MKIIIEKTDEVSKSKTIGLELSVKVHAELEQLILKCREKGIPMSKKRLCEKIVTEAIKGVEIR